MGVPQCSILGPLLWNVMYDDLLHTPLLEGAQMIGYADDVALVGQDRDWTTLTEKMEDALGITRKWLEKNKLQMAPEKTEAIVMRFGRRRREMTIVCLDKMVSPGATLKYLGIMLDASVSYGLHIRMVAAKAKASIKALSRLMPNVGGPGEGKRQILGSVSH